MGFYDLIPKNIKYFINENELGLKLAGASKIDRISNKIHFKINKNYQKKKLKI